jgi:hypothetical protein
MDTDRRRSLQSAGPPDFDTAGVRLRAPSATPPEGYAIEFRHVDDQLQSVSLLLESCAGADWLLIDRDLDVASCGTHPAAAVLWLLMHRTETD